MLNRFSLRSVLDYNADVMIQNRRYAGNNVNISVLIATKNRPEDLRRCVSSILNNIYEQPFEIIVADQGKTHGAEGVVRSLRTKNIRYRVIRKKGKAHALNACLRIASGRLLSFTDDDCVVSPNWLATIEANFVKYPAVGGIFGSTFPYRPERHPREVCPATFFLNKEHTIHNPYSIHYRTLGLGNNMTFRRNVTDHVGAFREWIGPGVSFSAGGEDSDYIYL